MKDKCLFPNLEEHTGELTYCTIIFRVTNKILVLRERSGQPTFRRLRHGRGETVHMVAAVTVVAEEQLVLEEARRRGKGQVSDQWGWTGTGASADTAASSEGGEAAGGEAQTCEFLEEILHADRVSHCHTA